MSNSTARREETPSRPDFIPFEDWMNSLDTIVSMAAGMSVHDLPDMRFRDAYEDGDSPEDFALDNLGIKEGKLTDINTFREAIMG